MSAVAEMTEATFEQEVLKSDVPVLVDFWAPWCGPCRSLAPIVDELAQDYQGKAKVYKVNTDENLNLAQKYRISSIPCVMIFKNGDVAEQAIGVQPKANLAAMIDKHL